MSEDASTPVAGQLWSFRYAHKPWVGNLLQLGPEWAELVAQRQYAPAAAALLGEALCTVGLLVGSAKNPPRLTLQLSGVQGLELLVAQSLRPGQLRGMVKPADLQQPPFGCGGRLVVTLEAAQLGQPMQSIVPLDAANLAAAMSTYFRQSEQLPTGFYLYADAQQAFGLMVQQVAHPASTGESAGEAPPEVLERWALRALPPQPQKYLGALLEADIVLLDTVQDWLVRCHCDRGSVSRMLLSLGQTEAEAVLAERGQIDIECGYCGQAYVYDRADVTQLFLAEAATPQPPTAH